MEAELNKLRSQLPPEMQQMFAALHKQNSSTDSSSGFASNSSAGIGESLRAPPMFKPISQTEQTKNTKINVKIVFFFRNFILNHFNIVVEINFNCVDWNFIDIVSITILFGIFIFHLDYCKKNFF